MGIARFILLFILLCGGIYVFSGYRQWQQYVAVSESGIETYAVVIDKEVLSPEIDGQVSRIPKLTVKITDTLGIDHIMRVIVEPHTWKLNSIDDTLEVRHALPTKNIVTVIEDTAITEGAQYNFIWRAASVFIIVILPLILGLAIKLLR